VRHLSDIVDPRQSHVDNVVPIRRTKPRPRSSRPVVLFDHENPEVHAADRCVLLTLVEAKAIASLLQSARAHLPSPKACDEAVSILTGKRS
jgi:hypothetical protein